MPELHLILEKHLGGQVETWACRGEGKGCKRNRYRTSRVHCEDCLGPLAKKATLADVQRQLERGDA